MCIMPVKAITPLVTELACRFVLPLPRSTLVIFLLSSFYRGREAESMLKLAVWQRERVCLAQMCQFTLKRY